MSSRNKSTTGSTRKVSSPKKESHALHEHGLKSLYLTVFQSTKEEITAQDELLLCLYDNFLSMSKLRRSF